MIKIRETQINLTAEAGRTAEGCIHIDAASSGRVTGEVISDYVRIVPARAAMSQFPFMRIRRDCGKVNLSRAVCFC